MTTQKSNNFDKYNPAKIYGSYIFNETLKYQKNIILILDKVNMLLGIMKQMPLNTLLCKLI